MNTDLVKFVLFMKTRGLGRFRWKREGFSGEQGREGHLTLGPVPVEVCQGLFPMISV